MEVKIVAKETQDMVSVWAKVYGLILTKLEEVLHAERKELHAQSGASNLCQ